MIIRSLASLCALLCLFTAARAQPPVDASQLLELHRRAMKPVYELFASSPVRVDYLKGNPADDNRISFHWQGGKFRQEYHWLGFTEVFGFDGSDNWYGSDLDMPYSLDRGNGLDITEELACNFAYLSPGAEGELSVPESVPLGLGEKYAVLKFAPPGMSEALLLLDKENYRLAGLLQGSDGRLEDTVLYSLTTFEQWQDFGPGWYPAVLRTKTLSLEGEQIRERVMETQSVAMAEPLPAEMFSRQSSPPVAQPALPTVPYEMPFSFLTDTVVLPCTGPDGKAMRLEFDTGASVGLLRRDVVRRLGLKPVGKEFVSGHGGSASVSYVRVEGVRLPGGVELPAWPAAVLQNGKEGTGLEESLAGNSVAGLLGNFVLSHFVVQLDYRRRRVLMWPPASFDPARDLSPGYIAIPCKRASMPYVDVTVDGKLKGGAFFNTGAQQFFTLEAWAVEQAGLDYELERIGTGVTVKGFTVFGIIEPGEVRINGLTIEKPLTHLELLAPGEVPDPHSIASFGNEFFQRYKVTFDLYHEMYYIEKM